MALTASEKTLLNSWADQLEVAQTWVGGDRADALGRLAGEIRSFKGGAKNAEKLVATEGVDSTTDS